MRGAISLEADSNSSLDDTNAAVRNMFLTMTLLALLGATIENVMRELEWEGMGVKVDGRQLRHLRFADDIYS
ncbi:unnamed protein product [Heligmosomoides polygyrus]|uniref:Reverse transcriptase domain-containing protein n=1 Tax=Heligmosomoides polygyrus TaxID=6339 RepID=A0A183FK24_HELPZ|nr:unnamed protein product [Heligmosomoides polygyrus]